jgi:hypothetical protein
VATGRFPEAQLQGPHFGDETGKGAGMSRPLPAAEHFRIDWQVYLASCRSLSSSRNQNSVRAVIGGRLETTQAELQPTSAFNARDREVSTESGR